jgi:cell division protein FtsI (penicillin-binding protein 3)
MRRRRTQKNKQSQMIYGRFLLIVGVWVIWMGVIGVQLVHLQVNQHEELSRRAMNQRRQNIREKQLRGTIFDRDGNQLAVSVNVETLFIQPDKIQNVEVTGARLASVLKEKPKDVIARIKKSKDEGKKYVRFAPELDDEKVEKIKAYELDGIAWEKDQKRTYPHQMTAAQVVGFSNMDDKGQAGIEASQEKNLQGDEIDGYHEHDRLGRVYESSENAAQPAKDVYLTINSTIQYEAEKALADGIAAAGAKGGTAIVLDPKTGEILAMASSPTFDLNVYQKASPGAWKNRSIEEFYSPGSVFKLVAYGGALDSGLIKPDEQIDCNNGSIVVAGHKYTDGHPLGTAPLTKALAVSNNVAAIKIAQRLDRDRFYDYARRFGMGSDTGVELPSETAGILRSPKNWAGDSLASMAIGYEIGVTSLQMASAYAAIANDGVRIQPHVVTKINEPGKDPSYVAQPQSTQVISADAARSLRNMMREVVLSGTGKRAQLEGYTVSGKTGTAWKYDPKRGYTEGRRVSSFIGMAPADNPAVVIAIMLDEPTIGVRDGGTVAAPVFKAIAEQVLPQLNIRPDKNIHATFVQGTDAAKDDKEGTEPPVGGKTVAVNDKNAAGDKTGEKSDKGDKDNKGDKDKGKKPDDKAVAIDKKKAETKPKNEKDKSKSKT